MMQCVANVAKIAKYPSGQVVRSRYIAVIVLREKAEEIIIDQAEETFLGVILMIEAQGAT